jgi:Protein of unknown function (DUF3352)
VPRRAAVLVVSVLVPLAGCGGGGGSSGDAGRDAAPAAAVPATAPLYVEIVVRPDGELRTKAEAALRKILRADDAPGKATELFDRAARRGGLRWKDLSPWLGRRVGLFVTSVHGRRADGAVVAAQTDAGRARDSMERLLRARGGAALSRRTYRGVAYAYEQRTDEAAGIVAGYAVVGSEGAFKEVVDTTRGGAALAGADRYRRARESVKADGALGFAYADPRALAEGGCHRVAAGGDAMSFPCAAAALARVLSAAADPPTSAPPSGPSGDRPAHPGASGDRPAHPGSSGDRPAHPGSSGDRPAHPGSSGAGRALLGALASRLGDAVGVALRADGGAVRLVGAAPDAPAGGDGAGAAAGAVAALPSDAWLALGVGDLGALGRQALDALPALAAVHGAEPARALDAFERRTGLDVRRDLLSWMGSAALYARGTWLLDLGGALVIHSKDRARSLAAVGKIGRALQREGMVVAPASLPGYDVALRASVPGFPVPAFVAAGGDLFAVGLNAGAMAAVARPSDRLADAPSYREAARLIGAGLRPSMVVDLPSVLRLADGLGLAGPPGYRIVEPYLDAFGLVAAGAGRSRGTLAAALQ